MSGGEMALHSDAGEERQTRCFKMMTLWPCSPTSVPHISQPYAPSVWRYSVSVGAVGPASGCGRGPSSWIT